MVEVKPENKKLLESFDVSVEELPQENEVAFFLLFINVQLHC